MATCPNCNKQIDDDSYYCEHCGEKLYACPRCRTIGKGEGKCCGQCGSKLVEASSFGINTTPAPESVQQPAPQYASQPIQQSVPQQPIQQSAPQQVQQPIQQLFQQSVPQPVQQSALQTFQLPVTQPGSQPIGLCPPISGSQTVVNAVPTSLYCAANNIRLPLINGALIGRTQGNYAALLGGCQYVSSRHATLLQTNTGWVITDLGSTNGTKVNGVTCSPSLSFKLGDIVRLANFYDFKAE